MSRNRTVGEVMVVDDSRKVIVENPGRVIIWNELSTLAAWLAMLNNSTNDERRRQRSAVSSWTD